MSERDSEPSADNEALLARVEHLERELARLIEHINGVHQRLSRRSHSIDRLIAEREAEIARILRLIEERRKRQAQ